MFKTKLFRKNKFYINKSLVSLLLVFHFFGLYDYKMNSVFQAKYLLYIIFFLLSFW